MGKPRCIDGGGVARTIEVLHERAGLCAGHRIGKHSVKLSDCKRQRRSERETGRERERDRVLTMYIDKQRVQG